MVVSIFVKKYFAYSPKLRHLQLKLQIIKFMLSGYRPGSRPGYDYRPGYTGSNIGYPNYRPGYQYRSGNDRYPGYSNYISGYEGYDNFKVVARRSEVKNVDTAV